MNKKTVALSLSMLIIGIAGYAIWQYLTPYEPAFRMGLIVPLEYERAEGERIDYQGQLDINQDGIEEEIVLTSTEGSGERTLMIFKHFDAWTKIHEEKIAAAGDLFPVQVFDVTNDGIDEHLMLFTDDETAFLLSWNDEENKKIRLSCEDKKSMIKRMKCFEKTNIKHIDMPTREEWPNSYAKKLLKQDEQMGKVWYFSGEDFNKHYIAVCKQSVEQCGKNFDDDRLSAAIGFTMIWSKADNKFLFSNLERSDTKE